MHTGFVVVYAQLGLKLSSQWVSRNAASPMFFRCGEELCTTAVRKDRNGYIPYRCNLAGGRQDTLLHDLNYLPSLLVNVQT